MTGDARPVLCPWCGLGFVPGEHNRLHRDTTGRLRLWHPRCHVDFIAALERGDEWTPEEERQEQTGGTVTV